MTRTNTVNRVPLHSAASVNQRVLEQTEADVRRFGVSRASVDDRLRELDEEWDVERLLETNASALAFAGVVLGVAVDKRWLALPALVTAFLFQHAVQGWCPPLPILRRLGYRTAREIEIERVALKRLRGDFGAENFVGGGSGDRAKRAYESALR
jgi:hypothetical protein